MNNRGFVFFYCTYLWVKDSFAEYLFRKLSTHIRLRGKGEIIELQGTNYQNLKVGAWYIFPNNQRTASVWWIKNKSFSCDWCCYLFKHCHLVFWQDIAKQRRMIRQLLWLGKIWQIYNSSEHWMFVFYGFIFKSDSERMKGMYNKSA